MNGKFESTEELFKAMHCLSDNIFELDDLALIMNLSTADTMIHEMSSEEIMATARATLLEMRKTRGSSSPKREEAWRTADAPACSGMDRKEGEWKAVGKEGAEEEENGTAVIGTSVRQ